ncbi:MAG TPA: hypothetical protein VLC09_15445 [Polyangiaceae bacterium]|nr:hypothetical protein [Polyangiaceae bacterium]
MKFGLGVGLGLALTIPAASAWAQQPAPSATPPSAAEPAAAPPATDPALAAEPGAPGTVSLDAEPAPEPAPHPRPTAGPPPPPPVSTEAPPEPVVPFAQDTLAGQFQLGIAGLFTVPFGELSRGVDAFSQTDVGYGPSVDLGIGIARHVVVGAYGELALHSAASACTDCSSTGIAAGAFIRYHLVQGLRFDPWISYGLGYRGLDRTSSNQGDASYAGLEWLRLQFGGDWYAFRQLGIGPFVELGAASFLSVPNGKTAGGVTWRFQAGLRLTVDLPGR